MKTLFAFILFIHISAQAQRTTSYGNMVDGFNTVTSTGGTEYITIVDATTKQSYKIAVSNLSIPALATYFTSAESKSIISNGSDMTSAINAALAESTVKGLVMDTKTGTDVVVNGTVTVPAGKYLVFNGNRITGSGTIKKGTIIAYPDQQILATTITLDSVKTIDGVITPDWFGAIPNDLVDDIVAVQKVADYASQNNVGVKTVQFNSGNYRFSKGANFYKRNASNPNEYDQINVWIRGINTSQTTSSAYETTISMLSDSSFAIGIEKGKGCIIENLGIFGTNAFNYTVAQCFDSASTFVLGNQSTNRYSPQAGIVFDAFGDGLASQDQYKDFTAFYTNTSNGGSTTCTIRNISVFNMVVAIVFSPSGSTQNNEGHNLDHIWIGNCREGIVTTNSQERTVKITNLNVWAPMKTVVANNVYGDRIGDIPMIDVANIAGAIFQFMDFNGSLGQAIGSFANIYTENSYRIGNCRAFNTTFTNCQFYFYDVRELNQGPPAYIYYSNLGKTLFEGCTFVYLHGLPQAWPMNFIGKAQFVNSRIQNQVGSVSTSNISYNEHEYDLVDFHAFNGTVRKNDLLSSSNEFRFSGQGSTIHFLPFGTEVTTFGGGTGVTLSDGWKAKQIRRSLSPLIKRLPLGTVSITVSGDSATATVASLAGASAFNGLVVYASNYSQVVDGFTFNGGQVGIISSIDGSGNIVMDKVIKGITTGSYNLYIEKPTTISDWYIGNLGGTSMTSVNGSSGAATLAAGLYFIYGQAMALVTSSGSGTATLAFNTSGEGNRTILCPFEYEEYGFTTSDPLTNAAFPDGTFFTKGSVYRKINGDGTTYGWQCTKSGFKGGTLAPEFIELITP